MSTTKNKKNITPGQCKAARAFLGWSQNELADKTRVVQKTITDFERGATNPQRRIIEDIEEIFVNAGIKFENDSEGQGVKLINKTLL